MQSDPLEIQLVFDLSDDVQEELVLQTKALQKSLNKMIHSVLKVPDLSNSKISEHFFHSLYKKLPLATYFFLNGHSPIISFKFLASSKYTSGMGRFLSDTASAWLVPGKQLPLISANSTGFKFIKYPHENFFCHEMLILLENEADFAMARNNLPHFIKETQINILAVQHARRIVSQRELTQQEKGIILQETISSLLTKSSISTKSSIYEDVQYLLIKTMAEDRVLQIKQQITPLIEQKPQIFERNLFNDLNETLVMLPDAFIAQRETRYITRMIAYLYLFRKIALSSLLLYPSQRHLNFKLLRLYVSEEEGERLPTLGIIVAINLLRENEIIEERHLRRAIESIAPFFKIMPGSFHEQKRLGSTRSFYIEVIKADRLNFSSNDLKLIQQKLQSEIKTKIETVINPIFMQKNEEETLKNILVLSNELKYVDDLPQAVIHFHKQTDDYISFNIIIVRIVKEHSLPIKFELQKLSSDLIVDHADVKNVGLLRKKYPKEANVLEIKMFKNKFLREDFSLDLYEARRVVYNGLKRVLGEIRDYNGGMISKQGEVLGELTKLLLEEDIQNNFLIENYFYSLTPVHMQSVLSAGILKKQFIMVTGALSHDYIQQPYFMQMQIVDNYCILLLASLYSAFKDAICEIPEQINIDPACLTTSYLNANDVFCIGYIYQYSHPKDYEKFLIAITEHIKLWKKEFESAEKFNSFALRADSPTSRKLYTPTD